MLPLLAWSAAGVLAAGLGALLAPTAPAARALITGLASALAAGLMLGVAYAIAERGLEIGTIAATAGAAIGLVTVHLVGERRSCSTSVLVLGPDFGVARERHSITTHALHSASEGVAIGAAFANGPELGAVTAAALILHNLPEGGLLALETARGERRLHGAAMALLARLPQMVIAVSTWFVANAAAPVGAAALGFGFAALVYLALAELLPMSYSHRGRTSIALIVSVAVGVVALLGVLQ